VLNKEYIWERISASVWVSVEIKGLVGKVLCVERWRTGLLVSVCRGIIEDPGGGQRLRVCRS